MEIKKRKVGFVRKPHKRKDKKGDELAKLQRLV